MNRCMQIYVINLEKDVDRRLSIQTQMSRLNLSFEFVVGVLGKTIPNNELEVICNKRKTFRNLCRNLTKAEIGCAMSHISAYKEIVDKNIPCALILEDDVILPDSLPDILCQIEKQVESQKPDLILLSEATINDEQNASFYPDIYPFKSGRYASSYIITNLSAKILIKNLYPINNVADDWEYIKRNKTLNVYAIKPALVVQNQNEFGSSTMTDLQINRKKSLIDKFTYKICRLFCRIINTITETYNRIFNPYKGLYKISE